MSHEVKIETRLSQGEPQATGGAPERTWGLRGGAGSRCRDWGPCRQGSGAHRRLGGWPDHSRPTLGAGLWLPLLAALRIASRQTRREHAAPATWPCTPKAGEDPPGVPGSLPGGRPQVAWTQRLVVPFRVGDGGSRGLSPAGLGLRSPVKLGQGQLGVSGAFWATPRLDYHGALFPGKEGAHSSSRPREEGLCSHA